MSRRACREKCDGQNARLPLPNDLKLGGLNGLVSVFDQSYFLKYRHYVQSVQINAFYIVFPCMDEFKTVCSQKIVGK